VAVTAAAGVFRHLVHQSRLEDRSIEMWGITVAFAKCGAAAILTTEPQAAWPWCVTCWSPAPRD
jgi:hypothetical protein